MKACSTVFLRVMHQTLTQAETMAVIRDKVRAEMPTLLKLYRADKFVVNRIVASATKFFAEERNDPKHPFRGEFDRMLLSFVERLGSDKAFADRINGLKRDLIARPELGQLARNIWGNAKNFIERSASGETQVLQQLLARMFVEAGEALAGDAELRAEINQGLIAVLRTVVAEQKSGVSIFIADQVQGMGHAAIDHADRNQRRQGPAIYPFQRLADWRACRLGALHARISAAASHGSMSLNRSDLGCLQTS